MGRPSKYNEAVADEICRRLVKPESLRSICKGDDMPSVTSVMRWLGDPNNESFREQYARARVDQADVIFDECLDIADDAANDYTDDAFNPEHVQRAKLRIDTRKWMAGKLAPKKYGEKLGLEHTVSDDFAEQLAEARKRARGE